MIKRILLSLALVCSSVAGGQSVTQLPRITPTTGLADSSLFLCADSSKTVTRACKFSLIQSRLSFKAFDSLLTTKLNLTSGTITGSPTWSSTFVAATGQRVDSATGAARASGLVGNPAITVSSCTGCGGGTPQDSIRLKNGAAATPSLMFANSLTSGLYRFGADTIGIATAGANTLQISGGAAAQIVGGAGNMAIQSGTGNFRTLSLNVTDGSGLATNDILMALNSTAIKNSLVLSKNVTPASDNADSVGIPTAAWKSIATYGLLGGAGDMTIQSGTGNSRKLLVQTTTSAGAATTAVRFNEVQQSLFTSGSAARPGIGFAADTTTGLSLPAAGTVRMSVTGAGVWTADGTVHTFANAATTTLSLTGTGAATLTGGAGNMTIDAGTGASRTLTLQTTTSGSTVKNVIVLGADSTTTFLGQLKARDGTAALPMYNFINTTDTVGMYRVGLDTLGFATKGVASLRLFGGGSPSLESAANNFAIGAPTNKLVGFTIAGSFVLGAQTNDAFVNQPLQLASGTVGVPAISFQSDSIMGLYRVGTSGATDTLMVSVNGVNQMKVGAAGVLLLNNLPAEGATKNAMCWDATTKNVTQNAAATCTVSARRYKENIQPMRLIDAQHIVMLLKPSTYNEKAGHDAHIGLIAEEADSVDHRLATRNGKGEINSVNYEQVTIALLKVVQDQQRQLDSIKTILKARKP